MGLLYTEFLKSARKTCPHGMVLQKRGKLFIKACKMLDFFEKWTTIKEHKFSKHSCLKSLRAWAEAEGVSVCQKQF
jgi:hypothetical protein